MLFYDICGLSKHIQTIALLHDATLIRDTLPLKVYKMLIGEFSLYLEYVYTTYTIVIKAHLFVEAERFTRRC